MVRLASRHTALVALAFLAVLSGCEIIAGVHDPGIFPGEGGTGGGGACEPGAIVECGYSGPADTKDVGVCRAGTKECSEDGTGYGPCAGEVKPTAEVCTTALDENCDGAVNEEASGCVCVPNAVTACYTGPEGTAGVGLCKTGTGVCDAEGKGFGTCSAQVTPGIETCADLADEDCDSHDCVMSADLYGDADLQYANAVAVDPSNDSFYVAGRLEGSMTVQGTSLIEVGQGEGFLLKLDATGALLWAKQLGDEAFQSVTAIAVHPDGSVVIGGDNGGTLELGGDTVSHGLFVARFSATGAASWARKVGGGFGSRLTSVAFTPDGDVLCGGYFLGTVDFGDGELSANVGLTGQGTDGFLARLRGSDGSGKVADGGWGLRFGDDLSQTIKAVGSDAAGNVLFAGDFQGTVDIGGAVAVSAGNSDALLGKLSPAGEPIWQIKLGDIDNQTVTGMAIDSLGGPLVAGTFEGTIDLGGAVHTAPANAQKLFAAKYTPSKLLEWSKAFATGGNVAVAFDGDGNALLAGGYTGNLTLGGTSPSALGLDVFVAKLDTSGLPLWSKRFGDEDNQAAAAIAAFSTGASVIVGGVTGTTDFGTGPLDAKAVDTMIATFAR